jgi:23S rRNA pseudouridine1911/1915/1917 synthase
MSVLNQNSEPYIIEADPAYLVVFKPPRLHSAPLHHVGQGEAASGACLSLLATNNAQDSSLLDWCAAQFPEVLRVHGKHPWEGGVLHRLDYETQGLILVARTQDALDAISAQQEAGLFVKEYTALSAPLFQLPPGFPLPPSRSDAPCVIESGFRPFGPGRKAVRPVVFPLTKMPGRKVKQVALDRGRPYQTEVVKTRELEDRVQFQLRLQRGFRHQIRCHLAWIGCPILNDALYGDLAADGALCLHARAISLLKPDSGIRVSYRLT